MQTVKTIKEYQLLLNKVRDTKIPIKVKIEMSDEELDKKDELDMQGLDVIVGVEYDEIISVS